MLELIFGLAIVFVLWKVAGFAVGAALLAVLFAGAPLMIVIAILAKLLLLVGPIRRSWASWCGWQKDFCVVVGVALGSLLVYVPATVLFGSAVLDAIRHWMDYGNFFHTVLEDPFGWPLAYLLCGVPTGIIGGLLGHGGAWFFEWFFCQGRLSEC